MTAARWACRRLGNADLVARSRFASPPRAFRATAGSIQVSRTAGKTRPRTFMGENTHAPLAPDLHGICSLRMRGRPAATWSSGSRSCPATQPISTAAASPDGSRPAAAARNSGLGTRSLALGRSPICVDWRSLRRTSGRTALGTTALDVGRPWLGMGWRSLGVVARANVPRAQANPWAVCLRLPRRREATEPQLAALIVSGPQRGFPTSRPAFVYRIGS